MSACWSEKPLETTNPDWMVGRNFYCASSGSFQENYGRREGAQHVEQVIAKVTSLSRDLGANPSVTEQVYLAMISGFINEELAEHAAISHTNAKP